ncbi:MAG: CAP domain-containing protein [Anaerolineaceae bacterium]|nr:CAP domain-containing protein [Anaerolineaceae bacterium]
MKKIDFILLILALIGTIVLALGYPTLASAQLPPQEEDNNGLWTINTYREQAGVAPVVGDPSLTSQCALHAAYMVENREASLTEDEAKNAYSADGSLCAGNALIYLLPPNPQSIQAGQTVDAWMNSPTHRMWLLYPTLAAVGYGYQTSQAGEKWVTGAALDVLSGIDFHADSIYPNWPARYPASGQIGLPAEKLPISIWWPYAGPTPAINLNLTTLTSQTGAKVAVTIEHDPATYGGHKHITLIPNQPLAYDIIYTVHVEGVYMNDAFSYEWKFSTGTTPIPMETPEGE